MPDVVPIRKVNLGRRKRSGKIDHDSVCANERGHIQDRICPGLAGEQLELLGAGREGAILLLGLRVGGVHDRDNAVQRGARRKQGLGGVLCKHEGNVFDLPGPLLKAIATQYVSRYDRVGQQDHQQHGADRLHDPGHAADFLRIQRSHRTFHFGPL